MSETMDPAFLAVQRWQDATKPWLASPSLPDVQRVIDVLKQDPARVTEALISKMVPVLKEKDAKLVWMTLFVRPSTTLTSLSFTSAFLNNCSIEIHTC